MPGQRGDFGPKGVTGERGTPGLPGPRMLSHCAPILTRIASHRYNES